MWYKLCFYLISKFNVINMISYDWYTDIKLFFFK